MHIYVKLDVMFDEHPKVLQVGPLAAFAYISSITYCGRNLTDGFVPETKAAMFAGSEQTSGKLVAAGLWEVVEGGYRIHDYLEHQTSKADVLQLREDRKAAGSLGGKASSRAKDKHLLKQKPSKPPSKTQPEVEVELEEVQEQLQPQATPVARIITPLTGHPAGSQALVAYFIDRSRLLGADPPGRVKGQVARLIGELVAEGQPAQRIQSGLDLMLDRRLHPSTLASCVHETSLPRTNGHRGLGAAAIMQQAHDLAKEGQ